MESVKLIECPRDAWQGLPHQIPTERKVEYLRALIAAGFRHIDAVSFVSPKAVPQMADSEAGAGAARARDGVEIIGIVVNEKGAERAIATGAVTTLGFPFSISETFLRRNQNQSPEENRRDAEAHQRARARGRAWRWSRTSRWPSGIRTAIRGAKRLSAKRRASDCRTSASIQSRLPTRSARLSRRLIQRVVSAALARLRSAARSACTCTARARTAAAKVLAAYDAGCRRFDSAIGGLGGCPFAQDELVGNIPTEEVLACA